MLGALMIYAVLFGIIAFCAMIHPMLAVFVTGALVVLALAACAED